MAEGQPLTFQRTEVCSPGVTGPHVQGENPFQPLQLLQAFWKLLLLTPGVSQWGVTGISAYPVSLDLGHAFPSSHVTGTDLKLILICRKLILVLEGRNFSSFIAR